MQRKIKAAIIGPGNIGIDLMYKLKGCRYIDLDTMVGVVPDSEGLVLAREMGINVTHEGIGAIIGNKEIELVFDATGARHHLNHAPLLKQDGKVAIDLTPAAVGPYVVPTVNIEAHLDAPNVNMVTCGGQATIPIIAAINAVADVVYGEIVASIASKSAGPGTRQNIDEFTRTTARGIVAVGGAARGKVLINLNPAEPPIYMKDTIYVKVARPDKEIITKAVEQMVKKVQEYVPGYRLLVPPMIDGDKVTTILEVEGAGHYLPKYAGNLDIMTSAAKAVGELMAQRMMQRKGALV